MFRYDLLLLPAMTSCGYDAVAVSVPAKRQPPAELAVFAGTKTETAAQSLAASRRMRRSGFRILDGDNSGELSFREFRYAAARAGPRQRRGRKAFHKSLVTDSRFGYNQARSC